MSYLAKGGRLEPLFVGKIGVQHIPIIRELRWRKVLHDPPLTPRYMESHEALERLSLVRDGLSIAELHKRRRR